MTTSILKNPNTTFNTTAGSIVSESLLRGHAVYPGSVAHYKLGSDTQGLTNLVTPGTYDLTISGTTPVRSSGYATVSTTGGYDTGIPLTVPFTICVFFSQNPQTNGQYVCGTGNTSTAVSIRAEFASPAQRIRFGGVGSADFFPTQSPAIRTPWRFAAMSVSPTQVINYAPQWQGQSDGTIYQTQNGTYSISNTPTFHIGGNGVPFGTYTTSVKVAEVIVFNTTKTASELDTIYQDTRQRMTIRLGASVLPSV